MASDCKWFIISTIVKTWRLISQLCKGTALSCYEFSGVLQEEIRQHSP